VPETGLNDIIIDITSRWPPVAVRALFMAWHDIVMALEILFMI
jgi:hypothetical protein